MTAPLIPPSVLRTWPSVPAEAWERLGEHRYRAPHNVDGFAWCVVVAFGQTVGQAAMPDNEAVIYAALFESAGNLGAHQLACAEGTPVVRPDDEANGDDPDLDLSSVAGRCWWCGKYPAQHLTASPAAEAEADDRQAERTDWSDRFGVARTAAQRRLAQWGAGGR